MSILNLLAGYSPLATNHLFRPAVPCMDHHRNEESIPYDVLLLSPNTASDAIDIACRTNAVKDVARLDLQAVPIALRIATARCHLFLRRNGTSVIRVHLPVWLRPWEPWQRHKHNDVSPVTATSTMPGLQLAGKTCCFFDKSLHEPYFSYFFNDFVLLFLWIV